VTFGALAVNASATTPTIWATAATTNTVIYTSSTGSSTCYNIALPAAYGAMTISYDASDYSGGPDILRITDGRLDIPQGRALRICLADGSCIHVDNKGNFRVEDSGAKVIYKASRVREFNPFINASDLLAEFIRYVGTLDVKRSEVQGLPLGLFVNWLVIRAAETDDDPIPSDIVPVPQHRLLRARINPRCIACQRYIPRTFAAQGFAYCNPQHAERHHRKLIAQRAA
jgi:hypothetical protein